MSVVPPLVLIGYGDIARRIACRFPDAAVYALSRQVQPPPVGHRGEWVALTQDLDHLTQPLALPPGAVWVYLAPPPSIGAVDSRVANLIQFANDTCAEPTGATAGTSCLPCQVIYASTTAIYGDQGGRWVDEGTPPQPQHDRGRRRLDAEQRWQSWCLAQRIPLTLLRIPGIYACDRLPLERIRAGRAIVRPEEAPWSNRIHAEDLADVVRLVIERASTRPVSGTFNIADGHPQPMSAVYLQIAEHFGLPLPEYHSLAEVLRQSTPMAREFLSESKRIDARAIRAALDWQPRYPDFPSALAECGSD